MTTDRSNSLADLRERLKTEHAAVAASLRTSLGHALTCGDILLEAKDQLKHGEWLPWLQSCEVPERTAQRYMRLARNRQVIEAKSDAVSDLGVRGALALLALPRGAPDPLNFEPLVDSTTEMALSNLERYRLENWEPEQTELQKKLFAETKETFDRIAELSSTTDAKLAALIDCESQKFCNQFIAHCKQVKAARIIEVGLTEAEYDELGSCIGELKAKGVNDQEIAYSLVGKVSEFNPGSAIPSSSTIVTMVRDIALQWLHHIEEIVALYRRDAPAAEGS